MHGFLCVNLNLIGGNLGFAQPGLFTSLPELGTTQPHLVLMSDFNLWQSSNKNSRETGSRTSVEHVAAQLNLIKSLDYSRQEVKYMSTVSLEIVFKSLSSKFKLSSISSENEVISQS